MYVSVCGVFKKWPKNRPIIDLFFSDEAILLKVITLTPGSQNCSGYVNGLHTL